ncbi:Uncharacterised protein [uncultured archaeon]|nr:Uncharacterised protein [uncultured archaeon]
MAEKQLIFGRLAREATQFDASKMQRVARLLNPELAGRKHIERSFPRTLRILESIALAEVRVSEFEHPEEMSDALRMRTKAELYPLVEALGRSLDEETACLKKTDRWLKATEAVCRYGAISGVGFPASSFMAFSVFNIQPTNREFFYLGLLAAAGAALAYAAVKIDGMKSARAEFIETVGMLVKHAKGFLNNSVREFADGERADNDF